LTKKIIINKKYPAAFFDRDGVLNYDYGYVYKFKEFNWMKGSLSALKFLTKKKYKIFIITNQSGIARGYFTKKDFLFLNRRIKNFLKKKKIIISKIEYCPHHPTQGIGIYKKNCKCRKPGNLMIKNIFKKWNINKKESFMIGNKKSDKDCAKSSNINFFYREDNLYKQIKNIIDK
jgi:D,D-heptose 1,7-bisphosphate phosphatase